MLNYCQKTGVLMHFGFFVRGPMPFYLILLLRNDIEKTISNMTKVKIMPVVSSCRDKGACLLMPG